MKVYFVRHGESTFNSQRKRQHGEVPLSDLGKKQAEFVANRFKTISIDKIISSDYLRAKETADIISNKTGQPVIHTPLAREKRSPSEIHGKVVDDPSVLEIDKITRDNFHDPNYHYSDEENFHDLKSRAAQLIHFIESQPEESVLVVLHGTILKCVLGVMMFEESFTHEIFSAFRFFVLENTGVTVCDNSHGHWQLITWNDQSHLGG